MAVATNAYLVSRLQQQKSISDTNRISHIIHSINIQNGLINIDTLAVTVNMSIRNFERHFMEYTGMPAKLY